MDAKDGISIVVPVFQESKNIPILVERISKIDFGHYPLEVLIIDDNSQDGTVEITQHLAKKFPWLQLIVRYTQKGLSNSVIEGLTKAKYNFMVIMDGDLSHPPEKIPEMITCLTDPNIDFVIGSRYINGGSIDTVWPWARKLTSWFSAWIARSLLGFQIKDPLSGFLAIRKETCFSGAELEGVSWKIGLELMVKCHCKNVREVPIYFEQRQHGSSKLNLKVALNYLIHLKRLATYKFFSAH